jgi:ankyrin repeat protein
MSQDIHRLAYDNDKDGIRAALANGADPNEPHPSAGTLPLQLACQADALDAVGELLRGGANADAVFIFASRVSGRVVTGRTALMSVESAGAATMLLEAGANVNRVDSDGWSALVHAVHGANLGLVDVLLKAGADLSVTPWHEGKQISLGEFVQRQCSFLEDNASSLRQPEASVRLFALREVANAIDRS